MHRRITGVGITVGPVVAGIIGQSRKFFRLFGDTVNTASRVAHTAMEGEVLVTDTLRKYVEREKYVAEEIEFKPRGMFTIKGKGEMALHAVTHLCPIVMPGSNAELITEQFKEVARTMVNPSASDLLRSPASAKMRRKQKRVKGVKGGKASAVSPLQSRRPSHSKESQLRPSADPLKAR